MNMDTVNAKSIEAIDILYMSHGWTIRQIAKALRMPQVKVNRVLTTIGYKTQWVRGQ